MTAPKKGLMNNEEITLNESNAQAIMGEPPFISFPKGAANIIKAAILLPTRLIMAPLTLGIGAILTKALTQGGEGDSDFLINPRNGSGKAISIMRFETEKETEKLSINIHGVGGNAYDYVDIAVENCTQFNCDQWSINRNPSWSVDAQKEQVRRTLLAAIEQGYKDIRLDGFSYGAGLARTVYHDLMQDTKFRKYIADNDITLHYTARNGYESEVLLAGGFVQQFGSGKDKNYIADPTLNAPKPSLFMKMVNYLHELPLFNFSLQNKPIRGYDIPANSRNYVVNVVAVASDDPHHVRRDGVIHLTNRTNDIERYGHTCIDVAVDIDIDISSQYQDRETKQLKNKIDDPLTRHCLGLSDIANQAVNEVIEQQRIAPEVAKDKLTAIIDEVRDHAWKVGSLGGKKINMQVENKEVQKVVPTHIKAVVDVYEKARSGKMDWDQALKQVGIKMQQAAKAPARNRDKETQEFYQKNADAINNSFKPKQ